MPKTWDILENLENEVKCSIEALNFPYMTPVQAATIPQLLSKKDVAAEAVTGNLKLIFIYFCSFCFVLQGRVKH